MANTKKRKITRKKGTGTRKGTKSSAKSRLLSNEVKGIILIAVGLFIGFTFLLDTMGIIGEFVRNMLSGFFGNAAAISAIFIIWMGINLFIDKREKGRSYNQVGS